MKKKDKGIFETPRFNIDFFEFSFLVEACIPPRPIARSMFWDDVINKYYHILTESERNSLYLWISKNSCFEESLKKETQSKIFEARYNPDNQYTIFTDYGNFETFKYNNRYYTCTTKSVEDKFIKEIIKK